MSEELLEFLKEWLEWAESPMADLGRGGKFFNSTGLCYNCPPLVNDELRNLLESDFGLSSYPFNNRCAEDYDREASSKTIHKNPERLAWVRGKLGVENA